MTRVCTSSAASFIVFPAPSPELSAPPTARTGRVSRRVLRCSFCAMVGGDRAVEPEAAAQVVGAGGEDIDVVPDHVGAQLVRPGRGVELRAEEDLLPPGDELLIHLGELVEGQMPEPLVELRGEEQRRWGGYPREGGLGDGPPGDPVAV